MKKGSHCKFDMLVHIVWITKRRKKVITYQLKADIKQTLEEVANYHNCMIEGMTIEMDHVHLLLRIYPTINLAKVIGSLKAYTARMLNENYSEYMSHTMNNTVWGRGYYVATVGRLNADEVQDYFDQHADVLQYIE